MDTLPPNENVRVLFTGLMVFSPIQNGQCRVAILKEPGHQFRIQVEENDVPIKTLMQEVQDGDITLEVTGPNLAGSQLNTFTKPGFAHQEGVDDDQDFGWLLRLDALGDHANPKPGVNLRSIVLSNGILHSALLTPVGVLQNPGGNPGQPKQTFMAEFVGANIHLTGPNDQVTLRFGPGGSNSLVVNRRADARYVVRMLNDPPEGMDNMSPDKPGTVITTDFHLFYDFFDVPPSRQVDVRFTIPDGGPQVSPDHPCGPGGG
jgi:hypothetical protein